MKPRRSPHHLLPHVVDEVEWEHDSWHVYAMGNAGRIHERLLHAGMKLCVPTAHGRTPVGNLYKWKKKEYRPFS